MAIKYRDLREAFSTEPPLEALTGGRLASASRIRSSHAQADNLLGNDRNVVARVGLNGSAGFQVLSVDPVSILQVYPERTVYRVVGRVPAFTLMPGHFLTLSALVQPSGMTGHFDIINDWTADGAYGEIAVDITWGGPGSDSTSHKVVLPVSSETYAGEDTADGASWANLHLVEIPLMYPDAVTTSTADLRTWSEGVTAEIVIKFKGGVRCVDLVIQQVPFAYARNVASDTTFTAALTTNGAGALVANYPSPFPVEDRGASDPTYGSALLADIVHRQQTKLGPVLCHWTSWDEGAAVSETDLPSKTTSSTTYVDMLRTGVSTWTAAHAGFSLSAGASAQQFKSSNGRREMRGRNACLPVRVWVYASRDGTGDASLQIQTEDYSVVRIPVTSGTPGWISKTGHLRCGAHAQDFSVLQVLGKTANVTDTLSLSGILIEYVDL